MDAEEEILNEKIHHSQICMNRPLGFFLAMFTIAPIFLTVPPTVAQSPRRVKAAEFPSQAATVQAFVPKNWKVEEKVEGDLNGDRKPDTVLKLIETANTNRDSSAAQRDRARVLLVLQQSNGQWQRIGFAPRLLLCSNCGGVLGSLDGANVQVKIDQGVLLVRQFRGSREATETLHRFRLDKANRLVLIGQDVRQYDRLTGDETRESSNFLTGQKITEKYRANQNRDGLELVSRQRSTIAKTQPAIETIDIEAL